MGVGKFSGSVSEGLEISCLTNFRRAVKLLQLSLRISEELIDPSASFPRLGVRVVVRGSGTAAFRL